jgi:hypothetical protein
MNLSAATRAPRTLRAEIAVVGASLGGVMAAVQACKQGRSVVLLAEHDWLGGQLTAQAVPPDEHRAIERGGASASYLNFRRFVRAHYAAQPDFVDRTEMTEGLNPGDGWVSRLCFEPRVAANYVEALLRPFVEDGLLHIERGALLAEHALQAMVAAQRIDRVEFTDAAGDRAVLIARMYLDATDTGALIKRAGLRYRLGKESHAAFSESDAPTYADVRDQQPVTFVMALRRHNDARNLGAVEMPAEYGVWRNYVLPHFGHRLFGEYMPGARSGESARLPLFASGQTLDWWRYRRIISSQNWRTPRDEVSLTNWAQNDFAQFCLLDGDVSEIEVVRRAKALSQCFLHWLQTEAPRDDGGSEGYPELQLATDVLGTADGFAQQIYVRESRRIVGLSTLTQNDIYANGLKQMAVSARDSVGVAWYNMDIHPTCISGHGVNAHVRPFVLPIGIFVPADCANLIPACKNISVTHLVNAATRVHPVEWMVGEVAGLLASHALSTQISLSKIATDPAATRSFQQLVQDAGIPIEWTDAVLEGTNYSTISST